MGKKSKLEQISVATYDRLEKNCILCLAGIGIVYKNSEFYHYIEDEDGDTRYTKCGNSKNYTDIFKGLSARDKESSANEVVFTLGESRLISMKSEIKEAVETTSKSKLVEVLADLCEDYFTRGLLEGIEIATSSIERVSDSVLEETDAG
jgi:hypothetical protein